MKAMFSLIIFSILVNQNLFSQEKDTLDGWHPSSEVSINISQLSFTNWSQGGQNSLSWAFLNSNGLLYRAGTWLKRSSLKISYGRTKISGEETRVNDNELFLETILSKNIGWVIDPYISNNIRTPIASGYDYTGPEPVRIVDFFDPGYVTQSIGFTYGYVEGLNVRAGFALQEIFTDEFRKYTDDPETLDEVEAFKLETGLEFAVEADYNVAQNLNYKSNLRLFTRFENFDIWDIRWDNLITAKISDFINVNFNVLLLHDIKQTRRTQLKEVLQIGIFYRLL
jgi:hypothetical protein